MDRLHSAVLTPHAVKRIEERKISIQEVQDTLNNPDVVKTKGPKFILAKSFDNRGDNKLACVIIEKKTEDLWVVITVMHNFKES